jgi:hypothetical protein
MLLHLKLQESPGVHVESAAGLVEEVDEVKDAIAVGVEQEVELRRAVVLLWRHDMRERGRGIMLRRAYAFSIPSKGY